MERAAGNLADASLVSKYHPVANYSYPRKSSTCMTTRTTSRSYSRCSSNTISSHGRESLGSDGSAPGLIEDRADSEVSCDDDYEYAVAPMTHFLDSPWRPRSESKPAECTECTAMPSKHYPALIPSSHRKQQSRGHGGRTTPAWPLPNSFSPPSQQQPRKAPETYSAFPKPATPPLRSKLPVVPARTASKHQQNRSQASHQSGKPLRPARPAEALLTPCIQQSPYIPMSLVMSEYYIERNDDTSPISSAKCCRPATFHDQRPRESRDEASSKRPFKCSIYPVISQSATHLPVPEIRPSPSRAPRHFKSIAALPSCRIEQEPQSVFEDDSDDEVEQKYGKKFFSFHRRSESDHNRPRNSASTNSSIPSQDEMRPPSSQQKRHGNDVFSRVFGRRSR